MNNIVDIKKYRQKRRKQYLLEFGLHMDRFIFNVLRQHIDEDFTDLAYRYFLLQLNNNETAWDYREFREHIRNMLESACRQKIISDLKHQQWYDTRWISQDEVIDRCLTIFILGLSKVANQ